MIDIFHVGPPKTATTWLHKCMQEHPELSVAHRNITHYYDMYYHYGVEWYQEQFPNWDNSLKQVDTTPTYIQSQCALSRLLAENPNAKIIIGLRNPIDRAFSHYWHLKKTGNVRFSFDEVISNYTAYSLWLEPGFIARNLDPILNHVPRDRIHILSYDKLCEDPHSELSDIFRFCGINANFLPSSTAKKINEAGPKQNIWSRAAHKVKKLSQKTGNENSTILEKMSGRQEYLVGVSDSLRSRLNILCEPEIRDIEKALQLDLSSWRY